MKILAIRGCNLASLDGEFEVDFRSEPLNSAGIFAITGKTGAGKTTILDAMCMALYRESPRLDNLKDCQNIEDDVKTNDIKTILRKGKGDGYAEVDFLAVDGNEYRVNCYIHRADKKADGNLQDEKYKLTNLTTGECRSLKYREHEQIIPALIGLEYQQFTRAVLLAQGKFSAFLKAEEKEKARMLTALTDTGIYSDISIAIFNKKKNADQEIEQLEKYREKLILKSDEEIAAKKGELDDLNKSIELNGKLTKELLTKQEWFTRLATINTLIVQAENELTVANERLALVQPEKEKLKLIDSIQPIRDKYTTLRETRQQVIYNRQQLQSLEKVQGEKTADHEKAKAAAEEADAYQTRINNEQQEALPRILKASQLEEQAVNDKRQQEAHLKEIKHRSDALARYMAEIKDSDKKAENLHVEQQEKSAWIEKHAHYSNVIPMIQNIIANLSSIAAESKMLQAKEKSIVEYQKLLAGHESHLQAARKSEEALKQTMSSEIAALRKRLVAGEPCPVCGSKNHETVEIFANLLEEKELEKAREENSRLIEHLEADTLNCRTEIEKLRSIIDMHTSSIAELKSMNLSYMSGVADAAEMLDKPNAAAMLTALSENWNRYNSRLEAITGELAICKTCKDSNMAHAEEKQRELSESKEALQQLEGEMKKRKEQLASILGKWKTANEMQQYYNNAIKDASQKFVDATQKKSDIETELNKLKGEISAKRKQLDEDEKKEETLLAKVNEFLSARDDSMEMETLDALLQISHQTIVSMRNNIETVEKAATTADTTVRERKQVLADHNNAPVKPDANEDVNSLKERLFTIETEVKEANKMSAEIKALLLKDEENRAEYAKYSEEYEQKMEQKKEWDTLYKLFGSSKGETLMKAAQEYTLDILLNVANIHLTEMTKRYKLARIADGSLDIKVMDLDMMGESRSAHSLSGGETFIVSLALSLALSSLSSNRMRIESLFIDEGFGALDKETLQTAVMMLEKLQSRGLKIGVISHLPEMLEQIPVKVKVVRLSPGRSKIEITDNRK